MDAVSNTTPSGSTSVVPISEEFEDRFIAEIAESEEVDVAGRPDDVAEPDDQHHCPLQHKAFGVARARQAVEQPLRRITREDEVRIDAHILRGSYEPRLHGLRERRSGRHARSASRYGLITRFTRQARA